MPMVLRSSLILFIISFFLPIFSFTKIKPLAQEGYYIYDKDGKWLKIFQKNKEFILDHLTPKKGFELYGPKGLGIYLTNHSVNFKPLSQITDLETFGYPTPEEVEIELTAIAQAYPHLVRLNSIGRSAEERNLLVLKITSNPHINDNMDPRPQFKYIANMHGNEIVGREVMILFIKDLIKNYGKEEKITELLDQVQLHILVSMNPDGASKRERANAEGIDLNRNFPDFTTDDSQNTTEGRAPETQAVMKWQANHRFMYSANFHGGAEVVNYPWDTMPDPFPHYELIKKISLNYASAAPYIGTSTLFNNGITNGYEWYEVDGGMQDWSYHWHGDMQITIELSQMFWPPYEKISYYYEQNRLALIQMARLPITQYLFNN